MTKNGSKWDKLRNNVNSHGVIEKRNSCIALLWAKPMKQGRGLRGHVHGNNCILLAHTSTSLCIDAPCPIFFFGEGASVHRLDLEVNDNLATNEIAKRELDSPPTNNSERIDTVSYLGLLNYNFYFFVKLIRIWSRPKYERRTYHALDNANTNNT